MEELVYVISGSPQVEPLRGKYRIDFLLDRCVEVAAQCSGYENPFGVVAVFLSRYGNGILSYNEASIGFSSRCLTDLRNGFWSC